MSRFSPALLRTRSRRAGPVAGPSHSAAVDLGVSDDSIRDQIAVRVQRIRDLEEDIRAVYFTLNPEELLSESA
jgi:hypothetical protein